MITNVGERDVWRQLGRVEELLTLLAARLGAERAEPDDAPGARKRRPKVHFLRYKLTPFLKTGQHQRSKILSISNEPYLIIIVCIKRSAQTHQRSPQSTRDRHRVEFTDVMIVQNFRHCIVPTRFV